MQYQIKLELRIDWSELDLFEHVNNVSYFKYIQASRIHFWEKIDLDILFKTKNIGPLLASCKCDFNKSLLYPGNIIIYSKISFIKNSSFGIKHYIVNAENEICAEADDVLVMFDFNKNKKMNVPEYIKQKIEDLNVNTF